MKLRQIDHQPRQEILTGGLGRVGQSAGEPKGDRGIRFPHLYRSTQTHHVVYGGLHQTDGAGNGGADDVFAGFSPAAVALHVKPDDDTLFIEKLDVNAGDAVVFDQVLAIVDGENSKFGTPVVEGAKVDATVVKNGKGKKIRIFKYTPKKGYRTWSSRRPRWPAPDQRPRRRRR